MNLPDLHDHMDVQLQSPSHDLVVRRVSAGTAADTRARTESARLLAVHRHADQADPLTPPEPVPAFRPRSRSEIVNRVVNIVIAAIALILLAPVLLLVALAVKLSSSGPVLYTQSRVGIDRRGRRTIAMYDRRAGDSGGKVFTIYKFRSMRADAEASSGAVWAAQNDSRVTPVGKVLRASRLDELPQLWNVIIGDMNIVGPRPERPSIFARLRDDIAEYPLRQRARPGITGLAQISQSYDSCMDDVRNKVRYDLEYLSRQGLAEDLRIMLKTVPVMLFKKGGW